VAERAVPPGRVYNIATGRGTSLLAAARLVKRLTGSSSPVIAGFTEPEESFVADIGRARRELGYEPRYTLKEGLCAYIAWLRARDSA
jgi:nucleoside-diphosphate-sugar epimerase